MSDMIPTAGTATAAQFDADDALIDGWLAGRPENTVKAYRADIAAFLAYVGKGLRQVTVPDVQGFLASLDSQAAATQARRINSVKSLLRFAHRVGYTVFDASPFVRPPKIENRLAERIVDRDAIRDLLRESERHASPRDNALVMMLYYGGLRISEVCRLEWRHVQPRDEGRCQVSVMGKGGLTRVVLLPVRVSAVLAPLRGNAGEADPVFRSREGGHLDPASVHRVIKAAAIRAGLPAAFSTHWLRHANASHALDAGAPAHVVQQTLGHASLMTTSRYAHARPCDSSALYLDKC